MISKLLAWKSKQLKVSQKAYNWQRNWAKNKDIKKHKTLNKSK